MSTRIYIIGMGPGREEMMTGEAIAALEQADVIVGYTVYVKLLGERFAGKKLLTTSMRQETERCKLCFREAEAGNQVALICSGDAGIYGLASLMYELGAKHPETELLVIPGCGRQQWEILPWPSTILPAIDEKIICREPVIFYWKP